MGGFPANSKLFSLFPLLLLSLILILPTAVLGQDEGDCFNPEAFITEKVMEEVVQVKCRLKFNKEFLDKQNAAFKSCATDKPYTFLPEEEKDKQCESESGDVIFGDGFTHSDNCFHQCYLERSGFIHKIVNENNLPPGFQEWFTLDDDFFDGGVLNTSSDAHYRSELANAFDGCHNSLYWQFIPFSDYGNGVDEMGEPWASAPECTFWANFACCVGKYIKKLQDECYQEYYQRMLNKGEVDLSDLYQ